MCCFVDDHKLYVSSCTVVCERMPQGWSRSPVLLCVGTHQYGHFFELYYRLGAGQRQPVIRCMSNMNFRWHLLHRDRVDQDHHNSPLHLAERRPVAFERSSATAAVHSGTQTFVYKPFVWAVARHTIRMVQPAACCSTVKQCSSEVLNVAV